MSSLSLFDRTETDLTNEEEERLVACESVIERGLASFVEVGTALAEVRDARLYRSMKIGDKQATFEDYCQQRWGLARNRAYQLIENAGIAGDVSKKLDNSPTVESHAAALKTAPVPDRPAIWDRAVETAPNGKVTAAHVEKTVQEFKQADPPRDLPVQAPKPADSRRADYVTLETWKSMSGEEQRALLDFPKSGAQFNKQASTSIEWAQWSWNPITGCKHDCSYCYARDIANRFYEQKFEPSLLPDRFGAAANTSVPPKAADDIAFRNVFACSMADLFGRWVPAEWIEAVLNVVRENPQWNFLFLTKFPKRYAEFEFPSNAWLGTTVDCQARVKSAEEAFARIGGGTKWLSVEPLLEPLRFGRLDLFDWLVIGGASASSQTPAWVPPIDWIADLHAQGRVAGCRIYYKDNCGMTDALRIREFPWEEPKEKVLPEAFRYLPEIGKSTLDWKAASADPDIGAVDRAVVERNGLTIGQAVGAAARIASVARQGGLPWEKRVDIACRLNVK